jgi:hypothetical protein
MTNIAIRLHKKTQVLRPLNPTEFSKKNVFLILEYKQNTEYSQGTINFRNVIHYIKIMN